MLIRRSVFVHAKRILNNPAESTRMLYQVPTRMLSDATRARVDDDVHILSLKMPSILDSTEGRVTKWIKKEGERVYPGMSVCRVQVDDMEIEMGSPFSGVLADILVKEYVTVPHEEEICVVCDSKEAYMTYFERRRVAALELEKERMATEGVSTNSANHDDGNDQVTFKYQSTGSGIENIAVNCLRHLKKMHNEKFIDATQYRELKKLTRQGDTELLTVYKASFETDEDSETGNESAFDVSDFVESAGTLLCERGFLPAQ